MPASWEFVSKVKPGKRECVWEGVLRFFYFSSSYSDLIANKLKWFPQVESFSPW